MTKAMMTLAAAMAAGVAVAGECTAVIRGLDGQPRTKELVGTREADGAIRYVLPAAEAKDADWIDFRMDRATAATGEAGFWMMGRGVIGRFTRSHGGWTNGARFQDHPYFAMKTPRATFIAIADGMRFEVDFGVEVRDGRYRAGPRWQVKRHAFGEVYEDLSLRVYELPPAADYNEMAKAYRRWRLSTETGIETLKERIRKRPHLQKLADSIALRRRHACKPYVFKDPRYDVDYTPETEKAPACVHSYDDSLRLRKRMKAMGIDDVAFCVAGWQDGGYDGRCPSSFPVATAPGGEEALRRLIREGQSLGYIIDGHSNYTDCYAISPLWDGGNIACKGPDGKILRCHDAFAGGRAYNFCLKNAWETFLPKELERIASLGFYGAHYVDVFTAVFPYACCDPKHKANRKEIAAYQRKVVMKCQELFGGFSSECDMDHLLGYVDYINYATREMKNLDIQLKKGKTPLVDKVVPFSELAFHDYVLANPDKITQEVLNAENNLKLVEFGGRPIFYEFGDAILPDLKKAYDQHKVLRHLQLEEMVEHRELRPGVVRVTYGNGDRVYVNHTAEAQTVDGLSLDAVSWKLVRKI